MNNTLIKSFTAILASTSLFLAPSVLQGAPAESEKFLSLLKAAGKPGAYEDDKYVGIYNAQTGILFDRKTGNLAGLFGKDGWVSASNLSPQGSPISPLWMAEIMLPADEKPQAADSRSFAPSEIRATAEETGATVRLAWNTVTIGGQEFSLEIQASLTATDPAFAGRDPFPMIQKILSAFGASRFRSLPRRSLTRGTATGSCFPSAAVSSGLSERRNCAHR